MLSKTFPRKSYVTWEVETVISLYSPTKSIGSPADQINMQKCEILTLLSNLCRTLDYTYLTYKTNILLFHLSWQGNHQGPIRVY